MTDTRPNILLIVSDQHRGDCLGIDGHPVLHTPNLDALACSGANFRRGASESPTCIPARRCLMTGTAPAAQGMVGMTHSDWDPPHTLAGSLRDAGYQTELVGKLHLQPVGKRFGFEHQERCDCPSVLESPYSRWLRDKWGRNDPDAGISHGANVNGWNARPSHLPEEQTHAWWCVERAIDFLRYRRDPTAPFFLNVGFFDPHPPMAPPTWFFDHYFRQALPMPHVGDWAHDAGKRRGYPVAPDRMHLEDSAVRMMRAAYYGTIHFVDTQIGRLLQFMQRRGMLNNTLVLYTSDHGEMLGDHYLLRKCRPYQGATRVPMLIQAPRTWDLPGGVVCDQPVGLQDVMPTLLDAAEAPVPPACTGRSLLPIVRGLAQGVREHLHVEDCGTYYPEEGYHMLLGDREKYVWFAQQEREQLFDLCDDPHELHDLAGGPDAEPRLRAWRERLVEVLRDRPEGFVKDGRLVRGATYTTLIPGYRNDRFYPYL